MCISLMKEKVKKEKDEERVKILGLEKTLQRLQRHKENKLAKLDNFKERLEL